MLTYNATSVCYLLMEEVWQSNWVDEDDDEDGVDLKEKPEDTKIHQKYYIEIRPEAPGVWAKGLINVIKDLIIVIIGTADSEKCRCVKPEGLFSRNTCETSYSNSRWILWLHSCILHALWLYCHRSWVCCVVTPSSTHSEAMMAWSLFVILYGSLYHVCCIFVIFLEYSV